jgi:hypothetical protein
MVCHPGGAKTAEGSIPILAVPVPKSTSMLDEAVRDAVAAGLRRLTEEADIRATSADLQP